MLKSVATASIGLISAAALNFPTQVVYLQKNAASMNESRTEHSLSALARKILSKRKVRELLTVSQLLIKAPVIHID